jgi:hypothetical protein
MVRLILILEEYMRKYMAGIMSKVKNVAKVSPKIMVQDSGPKNATLSPPK